MSTTEPQQFGRGAVFRTPAGNVEMSVGVLDEKTVTDAHGHQWPLASCETKLTGDDIPASVRCDESDRIGFPSMTPGFAVLCRCAKLWGSKAQVHSPCCGSVRRPIPQGGAFRCAECGWWWRLFLGGDTKLVWLGSRTPYDKSREQKATHGRAV